MLSYAVFYRDRYVFSVQAPSEEAAYQHAMDALGVESDDGIVVWEDE